MHSYSLLPAQRTFNCGTIDPPLPSYESSTESMTPKGNPTPCKNPPYPVSNVPADLDSDPSLSYSSLSHSSDSFDDENSNKYDVQKGIKINVGLKRGLNLSRGVQSLQLRYLQLCTDQSS